MNDIITKPFHSAELLQKIANQTSNEEIIGNAEAIEKALREIISLLEKEKTVAIPICPVFLSQHKIVLYCKKN
ncbi:MAG: hypothetical protein ACLFOZ_13825 [Cyclobacteriaceae bacterium]